MALTIKSIAALKPPKTGNEIKYDGEVPGFGVRITSAGVISYILNYRIHNRERRYTIGRHPEWGLPRARNEAIRVRGEISTGRDPLAHRERLRDAPTVQDLCDDYMKRHARPHKRAKSADQDEAMIDALITSTLGRITVEAVTRRDIEDIHRSLQATPYKANRVLALLSKMFSLAVQWGWRTDNPVKHVPKFQEDKRERWLSTAELDALAEALNDYPEERAQELGGSPKQQHVIKKLATRAVNAIRLLMVTGARRNEVLSASWEDIDLDRGVWTKPSHHTKQKRTEHVPLSEQALEILESLPRDEKWLFPSRRKGQPMTDISLPGAKYARPQSLRTFACTISGTPLHRILSLAESHFQSWADCSDILNHRRRLGTLILRTIHSEKLRIVSRRSEGPQSGRHGNEPVGSHYISGTGTPTGN